MITSTSLGHSTTDIYCVNINFNSVFIDQFSGNLTLDDVIAGINNISYSKVFLTDKDFTKYLGGIERNSSGHIVGAKAAVISLFGKTNLSAITEKERQANNIGAPVTCIIYS